MDELISKEAALNCFHDWVDRHGDVHTADEIPEYGKIEALPSIEIVRCKDCKYYQTDKCYLHIERIWELKPDDYCSQGERREV